MIIPTLGQGPLYRVHHDKRHMLNQAERRRAMLLSLVIIALVALSLWMII